MRSFKEAKNCCNPSGHCSSVAAVQLLKTGLIGRAFPHSVRTKATLTPETSIARLQFKSNISRVDPLVAPKLLPQVLTL